MSQRTRPEMQHVKVNASTATIPLVTGVAGQIISVYAIIITIGSPAVLVDIQDTVNGDISADFNLAATGFVVADPFPNGDPRWQTAAGSGLQLTQTGTTPVSCDVWYLQTV